MKTFRHLLLLAILALPILPGCSGGGSGGPAPAAFDNSRFDQATWN
jgi:hypothetical protein